jgi:hypothetical protein
MSNNILISFNNHFEEFVNDIQRVFPDDIDILTAKNSFLAARKANPKLILKIWKIYVVDKYRKEIESGNLDFFINKNYKNDVSVLPYSDKITESIDRLREPIKKMNPNEQEKTIKYIQNFTKLSDLFNI